MKKYSTLLFILLSVLSYSQNISETFTYKGMTKVEYELFDTYIYESPDSICKISVSKNLKILAIDYYINREIVENRGLKWLPKTQIGDNIYYNGDYLFVLPKKDYFLIQQRNACQFL